MSDEKKPFLTVDYSKADYEPDPNCTHAILEILDFELEEPQYRNKRKFKSVSVMCHDCGLTWTQSKL